MANSALLKKITFDAEQLMGDNKVMLLNSNKNMEYDKEGNPTGKQLGYKLTVVCPARAYEKLTVKVPEAPAITPEELAAATSPIWVAFEGFNARAYIMRGELGFTCSADRAVIVPSDSGKAKGQGGSV